MHLQMNEALFCEHLSLPIQGTDMEQLKKDLTVNNGRRYAEEKLGVKTSEPPEIFLYRIFGNRVIVPRHYVPKRLPGSLPLKYVVDNYKKTQDFAVSCSITLRDDVQREAVEALQEKNENTLPKDKILCLSCGCGKSVCALYAAQKSNKFPVLVIVHTTVLLNQWVNFIKKFYGLTDVPIIRGNKVKYKGYPIAVAMLQTLVSRTYEPEFYQYWHLIIADEIHRLGAETFSQVCWQFPGERWGLTATPKRYDGMDIVFRIHLGKICYEYLEQELVPSVYLVETSAELSPYKKYTLWNGKLCIPKVITDLAENESRNNKILRLLEKSYNKGRTILILGERIDQLHYLHDAMSECASKAMCVGTMKGSAYDEALTKRVIFATHMKAKEGLDKTDLDTLFIPIPFANEERLQQSVGRIQRKNKNKLAPIVVVFYDKKVEIMLAFMRKMKKWFLKNKYSVTEINC